jgi:hypothetical protein
MPKIKITDLKAKVEEVVEREPDAVYVERVKNILDLAPDEDRWELHGACQYQVSGKPACLIGVALSELGFTDEDLKDLDNDGDRIKFVVTLNSDFKNRFDRDDEQALNYLEAAQIKQDGGEPWARALKEAYLENYASPVEGQEQNA